MRAEVHGPSVKPHDGLCLLAKVRRCTVTVRQSSTAHWQTSGQKAENIVALMFDQHQRIAEPPSLPDPRAPEVHACHPALFRSGFGPALWW